MPLPRFKRFKPLRLLEILMPLRRRVLRQMPLLLLCCITTALFSCTVAIKDEPLYLDEGSSGATEVHFLTPGQTDLTLDEWNSIRTGMVCESASSWGDFKAEIEKLCSLASCSYDTQQAIQSFFFRLEKAQQ